MPDREVESPSSPIRRQAPTVRYPEKVERRLDRIPDVRYPGGMSENYRPGCVVRECHVLLPEGVPDRGTRPVSS